MPEENDWQQRFMKLKKATEDHPEDGVAWCDFGDFLYRESDNPYSAVRAFVRAQELLPEWDGRLRLGRAYVAAGETARGFAMMRASAAERPRVEAYCFLASAYLGQDMTAEGEEAAREALRIEPSFEEAHYFLGLALKYQGDKVTAITAFRKAISLNTEYADAWRELGSSLIGTGNVEEGVEVLEKAVTLGPDDIWSRVYFANGLWKLERREEAQEQYLAAIDLDPEWADLRRWYQEFVDQSRAP